MFYFNQLANVASQSLDVHRINCVDFFYKSSRFLSNRTDRATVSACVALRGRGLAQELLFIICPSEV